MGKYILLKRVGGNKNPLNSSGKKLSEGKVADWRARKIITLLFRPKRIPGNEKPRAGQHGVLKKGLLRINKRFERLD